MIGERIRNRVSCPNCGRRFRTAKGLAEHSQVKHPPAVRALEEALARRDRDRFPFAVEV